MPKLTRSILVCAALVGAAGVATPAMAGTGCNGVVNWFVWGCAGWDNNNGAQFPYYHKKQIEIPRAQAQIQTKDGAQIAVYKGNTYPVVGIVAQGGGNIVAQGGGNIRVWDGK